MGVPVSPRNIFPSNIQGLPTWYEVRVNERGYLARRGGVDLMVAMNPQTWDKDLAEIEPGGYLLYDSSKPLPPSRFRDDIHVLGVPLTDLCATRYTDPRERQLLKNIVYVGVLAAMLGVEPEVIATLLGEQYKGKTKLLQPNLDAFMMGLHHGSEYFDDALGLKIERRDAVGKRIFIEGNAAAALGCVYGGATVCAWYPITPSSSLAEAFQKYCAKLRVDKATRQQQVRDRPGRGRDRLDRHRRRRRLERRARLHRPPPGPGVSLMTEFIGLAYFAEIPVTIINVQRGGPSTGMPTRTQQADLLSCAYASHGDTKHVLLFPEDPRECFDFSAAALDLADRLQTPIFVMTDLDIGMNHRLCEPLEWDDARALRPRQGDDRRRARGRQATSAATSTSTATASRTAPCPARTRARAPTSPAARRATPTRATRRPGPDYLYNVQRLLKKFETAKELVPQPVLRKAARETRFGVDLLRLDQPGDGRGASTRCRRRACTSTLLRVRAFPFSAAVDRFVAEHETVFVVEQNRDAQLRMMLVNEQEIDPARLEPILHYDGTPITARFIIEAIAERVPAPTTSSRSKSQEGGSRHDLPRQAEAAPPDPAEQQARLHAARLRRQDLDAVRRLRPRLDLGGAGPGLLGARHRAAPRRQAVGHRLLVEDARLLPRRLARLQHRARPHAVGADRRQPRQPRAALPRRQRRRRLGVDRPRPVRARDAARRQHDLHRREQRRLRPDQGPVLGHRRPGQQEQEGRDQQRHARSTWSRWRCSSARATSRAASRATRSSWCR